MSLGLRRDDSLTHPMQIYDVSVPLSAQTPTYPGDPGIEIRDWLTLAGGDAANVSLLHFGAHSGTHVDAPAHFIEGGSTVASLSLEALIGQADVVDVPHDVKIIDDAFVTANCSPDSERVLFKTRNSEFWNGSKPTFRSDYTHIDAGAARKLVDSRIKLVGIDYLSVERFESENFETHHLLLENGVVILEGLDLRAIVAGSYELICLPLKITGGNGDGAPARAILRTWN